MNQFSRNSLATIVSIIGVISSNVSYSTRGNEALDSSHLMSPALRGELGREPRPDASLSRHTVWDDSQVLKGGTTVPTDTNYAKAIGRTGGCTATLVSPPSGAAALIFAAHCINAPEFILAGKIYRDFECYTNKDFSTNKLPDGLGSTNDDVGVCFRKGQIDTGVHGCISSREKTQVGVGDQLRIFGYGHPDGNPKNPMPQVRSLLSGVTSVVRLQNERAIIARGTSVVTPGDSGGPVILESDFKKKSQSKTFDIVGINSKYVRRTVGNQTTENSTFAPFDENNIGFLKRATEKYKEKTGLDVQICGFNYDPQKANKESRDPKTEPAPFRSVFDSSNRNN